MDRFTISLDSELARQFDELIKARGYGTRSEAVRDMLRGQIAAHGSESNEAPYCVANVSYVYNHHERDLAERLAQMQHDRHNLTVSTMRAHLDHHHCMETVILRGPTAQVRDFANALIAERGVRHGQLNLVSAEVDRGHHDGDNKHRHPDHSYRHEHLIPKN